MAVNGKRDPSAGTCALQPCLSSVLPMKKDDDCMMPYLFMLRWSVKRRDPETRTVRSMARLQKVTRPYKYARVRVERRTAPHVRCCSIMFCYVFFLLHAELSCLQIGAGVEEQGGAEHQGQEEQTPSRQFSDLIVLSAVYEFGGGWAHTAK